MFLEDDGLYGKNKEFALSQFLFFCNLPSIQYNIGEAYQL
ncbi:hypothetical protein JCM11672_19280 [Alkaliphilus crotonatoxidans]